MHPTGIFVIGHHLQKKHQLTTNILAALVLKYSWAILVYGKIPSFWSQPWQYFFTYQNVIDGHCKSHSGHDHPARYCAKYVCGRGLAEFQEQELKSSERVLLPLPGRTHTVERALRRDIVVVEVWSATLITVRPQPGQTRNKLTCSDL